MKNNTILDLLIGTPAYDKAVELDREGYIFISAENGFTQIGTRVLFKDPTLPPNQCPGYLVMENRKVHVTWPAENFRVIKF